MPTGKTKEQHPRGRSGRLPLIVSAIAIATVASLAFMVYELREPFALDMGGAYTRIDIPINTDQLDDLGLADIDGDGNLDIYGVNHSNEHTLLRSLGDGTFALFPESEYALPHEPAFPTLINLVREPQLPVHGTLLYWKDEQFHLHATQLDRPLEGTLTFRTEVEVTEKKAATVRLVNAGVSTWRVAFTLEQGGHLTLRTLPNPRLGFPVHIELEPDTFQLLHVGSVGAHPSSSSFTVRLRDRHALAWTRLDGDDRADVLAAGGGLRGYAAAIVPDANEQLFLTQSGTFEDVGRARGILKLGCASRKATWVDFDADGDLDLHLGCIRGRGDKLWEQTSEGFKEVSILTKLDVGNAGYWMWIDIDNSGTQELYTTSDDTLWAHRYRNGRFTRHFSARLPGSWTRDIAVGDPNRDGALEILVATKGTTATLLSATGDTMSAVPLPPGLPSGMECASWVDTNNDGRQDLFTLPGGIFEQQADGSLNPTGLLNLRRPNNVPWEAWCNWTDFNNDGLMDLVLASGQLVGEPFWRRWPRKTLKRLGILSERDEVARVYLRRPSNESRQWLQVDLDGPPQNRDGIGAIITLYSGGRAQTHRVGDAEDSHNSQGHYRAYFGLGDAEVVDSLVVRWSEGSTTRLEEIAASRQLVVQKLAAPSSTAPSFDPNNLHQP